MDQFLLLLNVVVNVSSDVLVLENILLSVRRGILYLRNVTVHSLSELRNVLMVGQLELVDLSIIMI